jgi:hypothetical protein
MSKVKHIVLLKFKDGTSEEQIGKFFDDLLDISETVAGVEDYVSGPNCSPEQQNQGLTHGFVMTFTDALVRDSYLVTAEHERYKTQAAALVESTVVFDFEI